MGLTEFIGFIGKNFGLLPIYAVIIVISAFQASNFRHLLTVLTLQCGIYITMFQAFNLGKSLDVFGLADRSGIYPDLANGIAAGIFVFGLGLAVYGLKRLIVRRPKPE
jgi:hypothetical protein